MQPGASRLEPHAWLMTLTRSLVVVASLCAAFNGCSGKEQAPAYAAPGHGSGGAGGQAGNGSVGGTSSTSSGGGSSDVQAGACTVGDSRGCRVVLSVYEGQESCFVGMQYCDTGTWTLCVDPRDAG